MPSKCFLELFFVFGWSTTTDAHQVSGISLSEQKSLPLMMMLIPLYHRELLGVPTSPNASSVDNTSGNRTPSPVTPAVPPIRQGVMSPAPPLISFISYLAESVVFNIGETRTTLKRRFYGHRSTVKTQKLDTPVGHHFNLPNHSISDMILQGIEALGNHRETVRLSREKLWIRRLQTIQPPGLNIQEGNN